MTVRDLMEHLEGLDPDLVVYGKTTSKKRDDLRSVLSLQRTATPIYFTPCVVLWIGE